MATPEAVKKQGEAADKMQSELAEGNLVTLQPTNLKPAQEPETPVVTPAVDTPALEPAGPEDFKHKYEVLQGMFKAEVQKAADAQTVAVGQQLADANQTVANLNTLLVQSQAAPQGEIQGQVVDELTPNQPLDVEDFQGYGEEMTDMVKLVNKLTTRNQELEAVVGNMGEQVELTGKDRFYSDLIAQVPDWQVVNKSKEWLSWLGLPDMLAGRIRDDMLQEAFQSLDTARVTQFFNAYKQEAGISVAETPVTTEIVNPLARQFVPETVGGAQLPVIPEETNITRAQYNKAVQDRVLGRITEEAFAQISAAFQNTIARGQVQ